MPDGTTPIETCRLAAAHLDSLSGLSLAALSRWYVTAPDPPSGQPDYINGVAALRVDAGAVVDAAALLARLMAVEASFGRQRGEANAARTLDLDIIAIAGMVRAAPDPILPHPRAHQRAFVLAPLTDVAPDWVHPVLGQTAAALLKTIGRAGTRPLLPDLADES